MKIKSAPVETDEEILHRHNNHMQSASVILAWVIVILLVATMILDIILYLSPK